MPEDVHAYIDAHKDETLADFLALLRIPSISAIPAYRSDIEHAAEFVAEQLRTSKLENVTIYPTSGQPIVYGDWLHAANKPTLLIYAHYDVQPVDPEDLWQSPPFEPRIEGDLVFARGTTDDKNQTIATIHAVRALLASEGSLPVNIRFMIEGEEESGGEATAAFVQEHAELLASDLILIADGATEKPGQPTLVYGCRGIMYAEITAYGPKRDLHSGSFGGNAPNPLFALVQILADLKDDDGTITIPGVYLNVRAIAADELAMWNEYGSSLEAVMQAEIGTELIGEPTFSPLERAWGRPTFEVHGFVGGFQGEGAKTVIPSEATVKVSLRLVPDQTPEEVLYYLEQHVGSVAPAQIRTKVRMINGGPPFLTDIHRPAFQATRAALEAEYGVTCLVTRAGGSVPISAVFQETLGGDMFLLGFGVPSDAPHSPNEHTSIPEFLRSVHAFARVIQAMGQL